MAVDQAASTPVAELRARGRLRGGVPLLGPAFVAAIAYVDPGNFATNFSGGAAFGYLLLWVIVAANLMAMLVQALSAKVGLATGSNLAQLCRIHFSRPVTLGLWVQAELVAIATDLAEVVGGAIALSLLFDLPLPLGGLVTGIVAIGLTMLRQRGYRRFELTVAGLFAVILLGFLAELLRVNVDPAAAATGLLPRFDGQSSILLATGILGATVMPHAVYLHSALTQQRIPAADSEERQHLLRHQRVDIVLAMGLAGVVNATMLLVGAALFAGGGTADVDLPDIHRSLAVAVDEGAALVFAIALLASGFASAGVGTLTGQIVLQGFIRRSVPLLLRRVVTLAPALLVLAAGVDPTRALVLSQVVLSFGLPFALIPLVLLTRRVDVMHELVNRRITTLAATVTVTVILALNAFLVAQLLVG